MNNLNFKREVIGTLDEVIAKTTEALKSEGFGILTRIDFHSKIKEKLGLDLPPVVILGACNPKLAYDAFQLNPDVTSLLPCNAVVRQLSDHTFSVEIAKPSAMMEILGDSRLVNAARDADMHLSKALQKI